MERFGWTYQEYRHTPLSILRRIFKVMEAEGLAREMKSSSPSKQLKGSR